MIRLVLKYQFAIFIVSAIVSCAPPATPQPDRVEKGISGAQAREILADYGFLRLAQAAAPIIRAKLSGQFADDAEFSPLIDKLAEENLKAEKLVALSIQETSNLVSMDHLIALRARTEDENFIKRIERDLNAFARENGADDRVDPSEAELAELKKNPAFRRFLDIHEWMRLNDLSDAMFRQMAEGAAEAMRVRGKLPDGGSVRAVQLAEAHFYDKMTGSERVRADKSAAKRFIDLDPKELDEYIEFNESPEGRALVAATLRAIGFWVLPFAREAAYQRALIEIDRAG